MHLNLVSVTHLLLLFLSRCSFGLESIDVLQPITKISPARRVGTTDDSFGYSVTVHQLFDSPSGMNMEDILNQTLIMVGAPRGAYPGGLEYTEVPPTNLACRQFYSSNSLPTNMEDILACYNQTGMHNKTGLVYQCSLSSGSCTAPLGNGDPEAPDGLLFDRVGDIDKYTNGISDNFAELFFTQSKEGQQMGATVYSEDGYFVACAPLWEFTDLPNSDNSQPRGQCVYSGRSLKNFLRIDPCFIAGSPNNQNGEGFCEAGFSVGISSTPISKSNFTGPVLMIGTPGRDASAGGVFYYNPLDTLNDTFIRLVDGRNITFYFNSTSTVPLDGSLVGQAPTVRPSNHVGYLSGPINVPDQAFSYYGFALTSGFLTNQTVKDLVVSAPKYNRTTQVGRVYIVTNPSKVPTLFIDGDQFGEQFGYSVATTDLNGDGWDDILVGAPFYIDTFRRHFESGRVAIYRNDGTGTGNFEYSGSVLGQTNFGRFGMSLATLGDINNDGYNDFAVGAPFDGDGVVYIYYGQNVNGSIVNTTIQQVINGTEVAGQVTNLTSVSSFGFSLCGSTDIDQNEYRDLVVGAFESQSIFILRTIPVAVANISFNINVPIVVINTYDCSFQGVVQSTCFQINVTSSYTGKGLALGFSTTYVLSEVKASGSAARLFFDNPSSSSTRRGITYTGVNVTVADTVVAYVKNTTDFDDFKLRVQLEQIPRDNTPVDTNINVTSFSQSLIIQSNSFQESISVRRNCGLDGVCVSDLVLNIPSVVFTSDDGTVYSRIEAGFVSRITITVTIQNNGEDSYNPYLNITIPKANLKHVANTQDQCNDTSINSLVSTVICFNVLPSILTSRHGPINYVIKLDVIDIDGNVDSLPIEVSVKNPDEIYSREDVVNNNGVYLSLDVVAISTYRTEILWSARQIYYNGSGSTFINSITSSPGSQLNLTTALLKTLGAQIRSGTIAVYILASSNENENYFYPASIIASNNVSCDESQLSSQGFTYVMDRLQKDTGSNKHKRSAGGLHPGLSTRQSNPGARGCAGSDTTRCITIVCNFTSLKERIELTITGYLNERFFTGKTESYQLSAFAQVNVTDGLTFTSNDSITEAESIISVIRLNDNIAEAELGLPWYILLFPSLAAQLVFVIMLTLLCFLGFFKRKKYHKVDVTGDETFELSPLEIVREENAEVAPQIN
ncbi:PREDICTED: integrin alpha-8-like [Amphimedon queenslandica]|uniref:Integrin alpha second immunoglobulin-like domain-containing protein n=1 Tax=Amphimedon queenslandica TaxID=400682 RepID=A0AAN0JIE0_AMPQE|nr:PREDICTED: integrin alpha-8-like [Amphimedon queenslandica]|eukprot:XP_019856433.1 PREDICTED: integrin alpha-8-like [Amphimedon queenslandica]